VENENVENVEKSMGKSATVFLRMLMYVRIDLQLAYWSFFWIVVFGNLDLSRSKQEAVIVGFPTFQVGFNGVVPPHAPWNSSSIM
jgi:hypothetical protein